MIDNGVSNANLFLGKEASEKFLGSNMDEVREKISVRGSDDFLSQLRSRVLAKKILVNGRCAVDGQGAMIFADRVELIDPEPNKEAEEVMEKWGLSL